MRVSDSLHLALTLARSLLESAPFIHVFQNVRGHVSLRAGQSAFSEFAQFGLGVGLGTRWEGPTLTGTYAASRQNTQYASHPSRANRSSK